MTQIAKVQGGVYSDSTVSFWTHTNVGSAVVTDLLCVLLPVMLLQNTQISLRDKIAILVIIGLGIVYVKKNYSQDSLFRLTSD